MGTSKFELSIAEGYVKNWEFKDAIRELIQNGIDQAIVDATNELSICYDAENQILTIGNKKSKLEKKTLLLGITSKAGDISTIGQFGEGYKMATLVLTRIGKPLTIYNYGAKEIWSPRFVKSKRYEENILTFFISEGSIWKKVPHNDLIFEVKNVTEEDWETVNSVYLGLQNVKDKLTTDYGEILLDKDQVGKLYAGGLLICDNARFQCGYNFHPQYITLGRDRNLTSDWDLSYYASLAWSDAYNDSLGDKYKELVRKLIDEKADDVRLIKYKAATPTCDNLRLDTAQRFKAKYGHNAIPATSQEQCATYKKVGLEPVIVNEVEYSLLEDFAEAKYQETDLDDFSIQERFDLWLTRYKSLLTQDAITEFETLVAQL